MAKIIDKRLLALERSAASSRRGTLIHPLYSIDVSTPEGVIACLKAKHKPRIDTPPVYRIVDQ